MTRKICQTHFGNAMLLSLLTCAADAIALRAAPGGGPGPVGALGRRVARSVLPRSHASVVGESKV